MSYNNNSKVKYIKEGEVLDGEEAEYLIGDPNEEIEIGANKDKEVRDEQGRRRFHGAFTGGYSAGYYNTVGSREGWAPSDYKSTKTNRKSKENVAERKFLDFMDEEDLESFNPIRKIGQDTKIRIESKRTQVNNKKQEITERYGPDGALISKKPTIAVRYDDSNDDTYQRKSSQSMFSHLHSSNKTVDEFSMRGGIGTGVLDDDYDDIDVYAQPSISSYSIKSSKHKNIGKDDEDGDRIVLGKKRRPPPPQIAHYSPPKITAPPQIQDPLPSSNTQTSKIAFVPKSKRVQPQPQAKLQSLQNKQSDIKEYTQSSSVSAHINYSNEEILKIIERFAISIQEAKSALRGFQPFSEDLKKQERYKKYLRIQAKLSNEEGEDNIIKFPSNYNIEQITKEVDEFYKSSKVFKPMNIIVSEKFVSASDRDSNSKHEEENKKKAPEHLNMFGALTRSVDTFFPERLLCKRFGVDMPDLSKSFKRGQVQEILSSSDVDKMLKRSRAAPQLVQFDPKYSKKKEDIASKESTKRVRRRFEEVEPTEEASTLIESEESKKPEPTNLFNSIFESDDD